MPRPAVLAVGVLALALAALVRPLVMGPVSTQSAAAAGAGASELIALRAEVERERREVARLRSLLQAAGREDAAACAPAPVGAQAPALDPPSPESGDQDLQAWFAGEPAERAGTDGAGQLGRRLAAVTPDGSRVKSIECRAAMCRVESSHDGMLNHQRFLAIAFAQDGGAVWDGPISPRVMVEPPQWDTGEVIAVTYLGKPGYSLPSALTPTAAPSTAAAP